MAKKKEGSETSSEEEPKTELEQQEPQSPDYGKQIGDLQETITKQGETIGQLQEFVTGASTVINTIAGDENLRRGFQEAYGRQSGVQSQQPQQGQVPQQGYQPPQNSPQDDSWKIDDVVESQRTRIIKDFESAYGIDSTDEGKGKRQKIAEYLGGFGWKVADLPLTNLRESLEKAYMGSVGIDRLREEGKLEGIAEMRTNQMGTMGSFSSGAPDMGTPTGELTSKQMEWMKKLRVKDVEGAKKLYNDRENEQEREKEIKD